MPLNKTATAITVTKTLPFTGAEITYTLAYGSCPAPDALATEIAVRGLPGRGNYIPLKDVWALLSEEEGLGLPALARPWM